MWLTCYYKYKWLTGGAQWEISAMSTLSDVILSNKWPFKLPFLKFQEYAMGKLPQTEDATKYSTFFEISRKENKNCMKLMNAKNLKIKSSRNKLIYTCSH